MSNYVDISGIDKVILLRELWYNQKNASFYVNHGICSPVWNSETDALAKKAVNKYIDYFNGRCIKCDLSGNIANSYLYDRDVPNDRKFQYIVDKIIEKNTINNF